MSKTYYEKPEMEVLFYDHDVITGSRDDEGDVNGNPDE